MAAVVGDANTAVPGGSAAGGSAAPVLASVTVARTEESTKAPVLAESPKDADQASFGIKVIVLLFLLLYITAAIALVFDTWAGGRWAIGRIVPDASKPPADFISAVFSMAGAILGCGVLDVVSFHRYVALEQDFRSRHVWGYFFAPWLAAVLGLIVFALLQSGLLIFGGGGSGAQPPAGVERVSQLGFLAMGFLAGFGWYDVISKIKSLVRRFFRDSDTRELGWNRRSQEGVHVELHAPPGGHPGPAGTDKAAPVATQAGAPPGGVSGHSHNATP